MQEKAAHLLHDDEKIKDLIRQLAEAEAAIRAYCGDQVDAIIDPVRGSLILLRQAQESILEEVRYHRMADILQNVKDSIIVAGLDGKITYWNEGASSIYGYQPEDMIGKTLLDLYPDQDAGKLQADLKSVLDGDEYRQEWEGKDKDGAAVWVDTRMTLMRDIKGNVTGFIKVEKDITERKRAEKALKESEKRLRNLSSQLLTAHEEERKRIAADLHDSLGASLGGIKFKIEDAIQQVERGTATLDSFKAVIPMIQEAVQESRRIMADLRPSLLDDLGVLAAINWHCREFQKTYSHIRIQKEIEMLEDKVPVSLRTPIYRIMQEALNNIAKHGKANLVNLFLRETDDGIEMVIQDNGQGFDVDEIVSAESHRRGLGLKSMRERAELSGGSFIIESAKGKGTIVRAWWPLGETG